MNKYVNGEVMEMTEEEIKELEQLLAQGEKNE